MTRPAKQLKGDPETFRPRSRPWAGGGENWSGSGPGYLKWLCAQPPMTLGLSCACYTWVLLTGS